MRFFSSILICFIFGLMLSLGCPVSYSFGLLFIFLIILIYFFAPVFFIFLILLLRPTLDPILINIRILDLGLGGLIGFILIFLALISFFIKKTNFNKPSKILFSAFIVFAFIQSISFFTSSDNLEGFKEMSRTMSIVAIFSLILIHVQSKKDALLVLKGISLSCVLPLIIGIFYNPFVDKHGEGHRFQSVMEHPNVMAFFLIVVIGCVIFRIVEENNEKGQFSNFDRLYLVSLVVALILTKTRSAWVAFFIMIFITSVLFYRQYLVYLMLICLLAGFTPFVQNRVLNAVNFSKTSISINQESSFGWRVEQWKNLFQKGMQQPFWGQGWMADIRISGNNLAAHNDYLGLFVRYGIFAMLLYYFLYFYIFLIARNNLRFSKEILTLKMSRFFVAYIPAFLIMSLSENLFSYVVVHWLFWALVGVYMVSLNWGENA